MNACYRVELSQAERDELTTMLSKANVLFASSSELKPRSCVRKRAGAEQYGTNWTVCFRHPVD